MTEERAHGARTALAIMAIAIAAGGCGPASAPAGSVVIEGVHVVSLADTTIQDDATVVVWDGRIQKIVPAGDVRAGPDSRSVHGRGFYLLPGLIDPHVHVRNPVELKLYLGAGITTVRNMNGNFGDPLTWRPQVENRELVGPRVLTSSPTLFDESPEYAWHVDGPDKARELARRFKSDGYDLIKVFRLARPTFLALIDEATAAGIPVAGHYPVPSAPLDEILPSGMVSIEHLDELVRPAFDGMADYDAIPGAVEQIRASGSAVGTILAQWEAVNRGMDDPASLLSDSLLTTARLYFGAEGPERLESMAEGFASRDEASLNADRSDFPFLFAFLTALDSAGVPILASTDAHQALAPAGEALLNELELQVRAGLSPYAALRTATVYPARVMGLEDDIGTLEVGKVADLLMVRENPLEDLGTLRDPVGVMHQGEWLDSNQLRQLILEALPPGG